MRAIRFTLSVLMVAGTLAIAPGTAVGISQPAGPMTVQSVINFTSTTSPLTVQKEPTPPQGVLATFGWGRTTNSNHTAGGGSGLWCSSRNMSTGVDGYNWSTYNKDTASQAILSVSQLSNYYSAELEFWYLLPSRGAADTYSFATYWGVPPVDPSWEFRYPYPLASTWTKLNYDLSPELARTANGQIRWEFINYIEGASQYPSAGQGATIDDIVITGYKYGPVRDLLAVESTGDMRLTWKKPYVRADSTTVDSRSLEYRVWRAPEGSSTWTELTTNTQVPDSGTNVTWDDTDAEQGVTYRYRVIAYDTDNTSAWGVTSETSGRIAAAGIDVAATVDKAEVVSPGTVTFTYTITNTGATELTDLALSDALGAVPGVPASLAAGGNVVLQRTFTNRTATFTNTVTANGMAGGAPYESTDIRAVTVYHPAVDVVVSPSSQSVVSGSSAKYDITVHNTGDAPLTNVKVKWGGVTIATLPSLDAGAKTTISHSVTVSSAFSTTVVAEGTYGAGKSWAGTASDSASAKGDTYTPETRIAGSNRTSTAVKASQAAFDSAPTVVIATGYGFPDALSAGSLAGAVNGPLLLVNPTSVPADVAAEIKRLGAKKAYIVGGTAVVGPQVESGLASAGVTSRVRLAGTNRYDTAELVSAEVKRLTGAPSTVFLATGLNFPDALAASSLSAYKNWPILLTEPGALPSDTIAALKALKPSRVVICGGTGVVSTGVESYVKTKLGYSPTVLRKGGSGRYATAKLIVGWGLDPAGGNLAPQAGVDGLYLATGADFPDALAGGVLAAKAHGTDWRPLMLTESTVLSPEAAALIRENPSLGFVTVLGGTAAVSDTVRTAALNLLK